METHKIINLVKLSFSLVSVSKTFQLKSADAREFRRKAKNTATATPAMMLIINGHSFDSLRSDGEKKQKYEFY